MFRVNRRQQRRTLGRYPRLSLAEARAKALEMLRGAAEGVDPRQPVPDATATLTYAELVEEYTERHLKPNARSWRDIRSSLLHRSLRHLRTRPAAGITKRELLDVIDSVVAAGTPQAAVNVLRRLKMLFGWALDRDVMPANPCERIRPPARTVERDRVLSDAEIAAVWTASFKLQPPYGEMYRMFLLTGQRRSEVAKMRWSEIAGDVWTIPREKVKKDRPHAVPLTKAAQEVLNGLRTLPRVIDDNGFVFTTTGGQSASSNFAKVKRQIDQLSGVTGWTIHDIRRSVRSKLAELGVAREVARKVLNHEDGKVDRIYNRHEYMAEKREALERWEEHLERITKPKV
jgi:integrase